MSFLQQYFFARFHKQKIHLWLIVALASLAVGAVAVLYTQMFWAASSIAKKRFLENPYTVFIFAPLLFLISAYLCRKFAPNAAGSGPEHLISALQKLCHPRKREEGVEEYLGVHVLITNIISSLLCMLGGGALGREGPLVQISGGIFLAVAEKAKQFFPKTDLRAWIVAGSAAGFGAAFNAPIAGIVFALEELSLFHLDHKFASFRTKTFFTVITATVISQFLTGSYVLFEFPRMNFVWGMNFVIILLVAAACGILAWILKKSLRTAAKYRKMADNKTWYLFPILGGLIVATLSFIIGPHSFGSGASSIEEAIQAPYAVISPADFFARFVNVLSSSAAGCAGGLLLPALALGAGVGSIGSLLLPTEDTRVFITTGMAAFLGALFNMPLTAAVLVLEMTDQRELILQLFIATLAASWVFQTLDDSAVTYVRSLRKRPAKNNNS